MSSIAVPDDGKLINLRQQAVRVIRSLVISGEIEPGKIYPVSYFAVRLGVSATPIREALFDLASEGLLEPLRNRGFRVFDLSEKDLDEILDLRLLIEVPAMSRLAGQLSTPQAMKARDLCHETSRHAVAGDLVGFLGADRHFHLMLLEQTHNRRLVNTVRRLRNESRLTGFADAALSSRLMQSADEHYLILDAIVANDPARIRDLMHQHLEYTRGTWTKHKLAGATLVEESARPRE